jgi:Polyketide cyclase / dehydrase and lipid transport
VKSCDAQALILARPNAVWDVLTDTGNYAVWDSGISAITGELRHGGTIRVQTRNSGRKTLRFRVTLLAGTSITWARTLPLGLARITRTVTLTDHSGFTHLHVSEATGGVLPSLFRGSRTDTAQVLRDFVEAVKSRAELLGYHLDGGIFPVPRQPGHQSTLSMPSLHRPAGPQRTPAAPAHHGKNIRAKSRRKS